MVRIEELAKDIPTARYRRGTKETCYIMGNRHGFYLHTARDNAITPGISLDIEAVFVVKGNYTRDVKFLCYRAMLL